MTEFNIIAGSIIAVLCIIIVGIRVYKIVKKNGSISIDDFMEEYGDQIIGALQDIILVLKVDMKDYESKEEYEDEIIHLTIDSLKENSINFGIPEDIVNLVDTESLANIIRTILNNNKPDAFSVLDAKTIEENQKILDPEVVEVFSNAIETEPSYDTQANEKTEE